MANTVIELRHSYVTGNVPSSLANGELAINTYDGKLFYRGGASNTIQTIERYQGPAGLDTEIQFNDSGILGSSANLSFNKLTGLFRTGNVTANTVTTRDYIQFGDGTKQYTANAGSGTSGNSFGVIYTSNNATFANATVSTDQITFAGVDGVSVAANATTKVITFAGTPGAQGLTVDYGLVTESVIYSLDYGTL